MCSDEDCESLTLDQPARAVKGHTQIKSKQYLRKPEGHVMSLTVPTECFVHKARQLNNNRLLLVQTGSQNERNDFPPSVIQRTSSAVMNELLVKVRYERLSLIAVLRQIRKPSSSSRSHKNAV